MSFQAHKAQLATADIDRECQWPTTPLHSSWRCAQLCWLDEEWDGQTIGLDECLSSCCQTISDTSTDEQTKGSVNWLVVFPLFVLVCVSLWSSLDSQLSLAAQPTQTPTPSDFTRGCRQCQSSQPHPASLPERSHLTTGL